MASGLAVLSASQIAGMAAEEHRQQMFIQRVTDEGACHDGFFAGQHALAQQRR